MEALLGFIVGYFFGTKSGPNSIATLKRSFKAITENEEVRAYRDAGIAIVGETLKQGLKGRF